MKAKVKKFLSFRFAILLTLFNTILIWITQYFNNPLLAYAILFIFFTGVYFLLNYFIDNLENLYIKDLKIKDNRTGKDIEAKNIAQWTEKTAQEIAQLKANEQFRKEFIGNVAHELKTPIFNIQGYVATLLDGAINDPDVNIKYLERTDKNVQRLITLVKDLDTISKLETGLIKPDISDFDLYDVISEVLEILEIKAYEYGVKIVTNAKQGLFVSADREKINEVIHNLVLNSIIYGKKEGTTEILVFDKGKKYVVKVKDNGIGIDSKHLQHIFERFYRVDKSRSRERGGSGLGLSIVKHIIETHNEELSVESQVNYGTTFSFTLTKAKL